MYTIEQISENHIKAFEGGNIELSGPGQIKPGVNYESATKVYEALQSGIIIPELIDQAINTLSVTGQICVYSCLPLHTVAPEPYRLQVKKTIIKAIKRLETIIEYNKQDWQKKFK